MSSKVKYLAPLIGAGMFLLALHNIWLNQYIFLPIIGLMLMSLGICVWMNLKWKEIKHGSHYIYIPVAIIALSIAISGATNADHDWQKLVAIPVIAIILYCTYLVAYNEGQRVFSLFWYGVITSSAGVVIWSIINPGIKSGGYIVSLTNYDIIVGVLILGVLVSSIQKQWWLSAIAIVGLFLSGSEEGIFVLAVITIVVLIRKDYSRKILLPVATLAILLVICTPLGITKSLYFPTVEKTAMAKEIIEDTPVGKVADKIVPDSITNKLEEIKTTETAKREIDSEDNDQLLNLATGYRWIDYWKLSPIRAFGYGFNMTRFYEGIPHNIVLIIIEQVGLAAVVAWLFLMIYCLIKTRMKYAIVAILALGVFDHFIWTQIAPWWWAVVGVAGSYTGKNYIFKEVRLNV